VACTSDVTRTIAAFTTQYPDCGTERSTFGTGICFRTHISLQSLRRGRNGGLSPWQILGGRQWFSRHDRTPDI